MYLKNLELATGDKNAHANYCWFLSCVPGVHVFGLCATALITDIIQLSTGYHAPYFLTVCKPNYTSLNTTCEENPYVVEDICTGPDPSIINAGRLDFTFHLICQKAAYFLLCLIWESAPVVCIISKMMQIKKSPFASYLLKS